ncbi:MAG TPA: cupin domain-containing protein, partial [Gammaproteobacteria bacterium]|nr:cupin domain-containing protein [Gammaproteobacteria bacterium]
GHNEKGKSVVIIDSPPPQTLGREEGGLFEIWNTDGDPVDTKDPTDRVEPKVTLSPSAGGTKFRYFAIAPTPEGATREQLEAGMAAAFKQMGAAHDQPDTTRHPGMHKTKTIDYIILLSGNAKLLLDDDEVQLQPFDVVVQRGTNHAWVVDGTESALFIAVLIDSKIVE